MAHLVGRDPFALVVREEDFVIRSDGPAEGVTQAVCHFLGALSGDNPQHTTRAWHRGVGVGGIAYDERTGSIADKPVTIVVSVGDSVGQTNDSVEAIGDSV